MPITPDEARSNPEVRPEVAEAVNFLIRRSFHNGKAIVLQKDILREMQRRGHNISGVIINKELDIEAAYERAGWKVKYDKPASWAGETYDAFFEFVEKKE